MPGRPPKPTALQKLKGETRPSRINQAEPGAKVGIPKVPTGLNGRALELYKQLGRQLVRLRVLTVLDGMTFAALCQLMAYFEQCFEKNEVPDPKYMDKLRQYSALFGLDPSSRASITAAPPEAPKPKQDEPGTVARPTFGALGRRRVSH